MLFGLAWRNHWRRPQRTVLSLISISIVTALLVFMLSFQIGVYAMMKQSTLRIFDGYAQLQPTGYADDPTLDRVIDNPDRIARQAITMHGVTTAAPRVNGFAILANGSRSYGAAVIGVDPASEMKISSIASTIRSGRYLRAGDSDSAILGDILARNLGVGVGGKVTMLGSARDGSVAADVLANACPGNALPASAASLSSANPLGCAPSNAFRKAALANDLARSLMILRDIREALANGRSPLVLTERKAPTADRKVEDVFPATESKAQGMKAAEAKDEAAHG